MGVKQNTDAFLTATVVKFIEKNRPPRNSTDQAFEEFERFEFDSKIQRTGTRIRRHF